MELMEVILSKENLNRAYRRDLKPFIEVYVISTGNIRMDLAMKRYLKSQIRDWVGTKEVE